MHRDRHEMHADINYVSIIHMILLGSIIAINQKNI